MSPSGEPDRAGLPRLALPVGGRDPGDLRQPVALVDVGAEGRLELAGHLDRHRRAADVREPERRQRRGGAGRLAERDAHRRHAEQHGRAGARHEVERARPDRSAGTTATAPPVASVATRPVDWPSTCENGAAPSTTSSGPKAERLGGVRGGGPDAAVGEDRALRDARGSRGEEDHGRVAGARRRGSASGRAMRPSPSLGRAATARSVDDDSRGRGRLEPLLDLARAAAGR